MVVNELTPEESAGNASDPAFGSPEYYALKEKIANAARDNTIIGDPPLETIPTPGETIRKIIETLSIEEGFDIVIQLRQDLLVRVRQAIEKQAQINLDNENRINQLHGLNQRLQNP